MNTGLEQIKALQARMKSARTLAGDLATETWQNIGAALETLTAIAGATNRTGTASTSTRLEVSFEGAVIVHARTMGQLTATGSNVRADAGASPQCPFIALIRIVKNGVCHHAEALAVHDAGTAALEFSVECIDIDEGTRDRIARQTRAGTTGMKIATGDDDTLHHSDERSQAERDQHERHIESAFERAVRAQLSADRPPPTQAACEAARPDACAERWAKLIVGFATTAMAP